MSTPSQLRRRAAAVSRVRAARVQRDKAVDTATQRLKQAILDAISAGASVRDIAVAAGMSRQRVYQILHEDEDH